MTLAEWSEAEERGRSLAAAKLASDPAKKAEVEAVYGLEYCRNRYPEAYREESKMSKLFKLTAVLILMGAGGTAWTQSVHGPSITGSGVTVTYTAGTVLNGGHLVSITAGTKTAAVSQADCSSPSFAACNFLYANSAGAVAITQTLGTAQAAGNVLLAYIETDGTAITGVRYANQSGTIFTNALSSSAGVTIFTPATAGGASLGSAALPFAGVYIGDAATNNLHVTGTATGARTVTVPDASFTVSGAVGQWCGTANACAATATSTTLKVVSGISAALDAASPAIATITGISPAFTGTATYACAVTASGTAAPTNVFVVNPVSGSSFTITGPNGATDTVHYVCVGY